MGDARYDHCAVSLGDGRVFVAGGTGADGPLNSAEIYGPEDAFRSAPRMSFARAQHTCTLLADGRVLVAGGAAEASAELFDPVSETWSTVGGDMLARRGQTATMISRGRVLLAGGFAGGQPTAALEIYDPEAEQISRLPADLSVARARHSAALLSDGRVLFIGGTDGSTSLASTEIFDPGYGTSILAANLSAPRAGHASVTLADGRILVAGGTDGSSELTSAETYSESEARFTTLAGSLTVARQNAFAIRIPGSGLVLIGGGESAGLAIADSELFDPAGNQFVVAGVLTAPRTRIFGAALADGVILGTGGLNSDGPSAACGVFAVPRLTFTKTQYATGETAVVNGAGFTASSGRTLSFTLTLAPPDGSVRTIANSRLLTTSTVPDATGQFQANIMTVAASDSGAVFVLTAAPPPPFFADGSSNTIVVSEQPSASFSVPIIVPTILTFDPIPASSVAGTAIPFTVTLNAAQSTPPFAGLVHIRIGPTVKVFSVSNAAPGTRSVFSFCCVTAAGSQLVNVNYGVDPAHTSVSVNGPNHIVVPAQVQLSAAGALPLFTQSNLTVTAAVPAVFGPAPTGTVSLFRAGSGTQTATLPGAGSTSLSRAVTFPFRATFAEKPSACFTLNYSGDGVYPPASGSSCLNTSPAVTTLTLATASGSPSYAYGATVRAGVTLRFPSELGLVNRTVRIEPIGQDVTLNVNVGSAGAIFDFVPTFALKGITASYAGGTDVAASGDKLALSMNLVRTVTALDPMASPAANPVTLRATVSPAVPAGVPAPPAPTGVVQFFDGTLFLGQSPLVTQANGTGRATLSGVARPVGARQLRAVYLGSALFTTSTSPVATVTIQ